MDKRIAIDLANRNHLPITQIYKDREFWEKSEIYNRIALHYAFTDLIDAILEASGIIKIIEFFRTYI